MSTSNPNKRLERFATEDTKKKKGKEKISPKENFDEWLSNGKNKDIFKHF